MSWIDSPQYLKNLKKIQNMEPSDKAVTQTLVDELGGIYAGEDMQKQLQAMRIASNVKAQDRQAEMTGRRVKLDERNLSEAKDANTTAENLGWGNIGLAGAFGYMNMRDKKKKADWYKSLIDYYPRRD